MHNSKNGLCYTGIAVWSLCWDSCILCLNILLSARAYLNIFEWPCSAVLNMLTWKFQWLHSDGTINHDLFKTVVYSECVVPNTRLHSVLHNKLWFIRDGCENTAFCLTFHSFFPNIFFVCSGSISDSGCVSKNPAWGPRITATLLGQPSPGAWSAGVTRSWSLPRWPVTGTLPLPKLVTSLLIWGSPEAGDTCKVSNKQICRGPRKILTTGVCSWT